ncbi:MAG: TlpA family protein disulfide reductase [Armatimonadetes bacterium]|nr:TlpA family protein disulfide reductase [Armatimonadota bacterium]
MKLLWNTILVIILMCCVGNIFALDKAQDFKLENMKGKHVKLSDYLDKGLVVIDFWATWCEPCKKMLLELNKMQDKYKEHITVITINCDKPRAKDKAKAFIKSKKFSVVNLFDTKKNVQKLYNITNIPRTIVIAPDSTILFEHTGFQRGIEEEIEAEIIKWINSNEPKTEEIDEENIQNQENDS